MSGQVPDAVAAYRQALKLDPSYPEAHYNLGVVLDESGQRSEAIEHWRAAVRFRPGYAEAEQRLSAASADHAD
jgi:tetratricopeptide (TPR) repeat protein